MAKVRDHYFEVRPDGTYIYLGSTNPVCVIRGQMATIQPPEPTQEETCPDCGHAVSLHSDSDQSGLTCQHCSCTTPKWYLDEMSTRKTGLDQIIAMLRDYMAMTEDENRQAVMDFGHPSSFIYIGKDGEQYTIGFGQIIL